MRRAGSVVTRFALIEGISDMNLDSLCDLGLLTDVIEREVCIRGTDLHLLTEGGQDEDRPQLPRRGRGLQRSRPQGGVAAAICRIALAKEHRLP